MKIILFDFIAGGHHIEYAYRLMRYLIEQDDEVVFVTWKPDKSVEKLRKMGVIVEYVVKKPGAASFGGNLAQRSLQLLRGIKYCLNFADTWRADIVHHLYLERSELLLYLQSLRKRAVPWKLFATLFWPYFIHKPREKLGLPKRLYHGANRWALGRLLKNGKLRGLFVHTNGIKEALVRVYGDDSLGEHIFVIPDPVEPMQGISKERAREQLGLPQNKPLLLFFGGLRWDKGPDILLKALLLLDGEWVCLLYTSPSPRDLSTSRMPSSA